MTRAQALEVLNDCGEKLSIVRAALIDCEFANLASVIEQIDGELEGIFFALRQEDKPNE